MTIACMYSQFLKVISMMEILKDDLKTVFAMVLVIVLTQTLFFMAYSYFMSGDPFIALKNFYNIMYNVR